MAKTSKFKDLEGSAIHLEIDGMGGDSTVAPDTKPVAITAKIAMPTPSKEYTGTVGSNVDEYGTPRVLFLATKDRLTIYMPESKYITFEGGMYLTSNKEEIDHLMAHPAMGTEFFKDEIPPDIRKALQDRLSSLTPDPEEYEPRGANA